MGDPNPNANPKWTMCLKLVRRFHVLFLKNTPNEVYVQAWNMACLDNPKLQLFDITPKTMFVWVYESSTSQSFCFASILAAWAWLLTIN